MIHLLWRLGRILLGGIFIYAAYTKLRQPWELFALSIDSYRLLPSWAVIGVARTLPLLELLIGILLVLGFWKRTVAASATILLAGFLAIMVRAYFGELNIDCGCFGIGQALGPMTLLRDSLLAALSAAVTLGAFFPSKNPGAGSAELRGGTNS
jgi:uncharacterized membrane protein YphA (DoxX/SURF4 family)